ncbi:MAG: MarR family winged helix-turn-helix transcriptional regulator [Phycisphaerae bacterium]
MAEEVFAIAVSTWKQRLAARSSAELSESQYLTLDLILRAESIPTVGELQRAIGVLPAQMSRIIRSLETGFDKPLIHCQLNPADKRRIDVHATDEGRKTYRDFRNARLAKTRDTLQFLSPADRQEFVRICRLIREHQLPPSPHYPA